MVRRAPEARRFFWNGDTGRDDDFTLGPAVCEGSQNERDLRIKWEQRRTRSANSPDLPAAFIGRGRIDRRFTGRGHPAPGLIAAQLTDGKRGRPRKDEERPKPEPTRLERQTTQNLDQMLADLPTACDVGSKKNSKGYKETWIGYKLHLDVACGQIPTSLAPACVSQIF